MTAPLPRGRGRDRRIPPTRYEGPPQPARFRYDVGDSTTAIRRFRYDRGERTPLPQRFRYDGEPRTSIL